MGKSAAQRDRESNEEINRLNRESTERINTQNVESQESINEKNLEFQRENLEYQQALQQQIFQREDSSYQRTVADMRAAGLSPLTMSGTNGAGEAISVGALNAGTAPTRQAYQAQGLYNHQAEQLAKMEQLKMILDGFSSVTKSIQDIQKSREETQALRLQNDYNNQTLHSRVNQQYIQEAISNYNRLSQSQRARYNNYYGINDGMSDVEKYSRIIATELGLTTRTEKYEDNFGSYSVKGNEDYRTIYENMPDVGYAGIFNAVKDYLSKSDNKNKSRDEHMKDLQNILKGYGSLLGK